MTLLEKIIHSILLSILFSVISWLIIDRFVINLSFLRYFLVELILVISLKFYKFTKLKLKLN
jgi:hypothetical protein